MVVVRLPLLEERKARRRLHCSPLVRHPRGTRWCHWSSVHCCFWYDPISPSCSNQRLTVHRNRPNLHHPAPSRVRGNPEQDRSALADQPLQRCYPRIRRPRRLEQPSLQVLQGAGLLPGRCLVQPVPVNGAMSAVGQSSFHRF